jgi:transcriptional regulator with XRE-family HTH domain
MNRHRANGSDDRALRRKELAAFLRARRESISPESAGLAKFGRRRTPGLRREEVAMLAEIGAGWYTKLEMAHDMKPSPTTLWAITRVLRLDRGATEYVFSLADVAMPLEAVETAKGSRIPLAMERLVEDFPNRGVLIIDRYMTVVRWTQLQTPCSTYPGIRRRSSATRSSDSWRIKASRHTSMPTGKR